MNDFCVGYTEEELKLLDFVPPTEEELILMVQDLEIEMSNMVTYTPGSGCTCTSDAGTGCHS